MRYMNEKILLIEYINDIPHSVLTDNGEYDFDLHAGGWLMFTQAGNFNTEKIIKHETCLACPEKNNFKIWVDPEYKIELKYPAGIQLIKHPIMLKDYTDHKYKHNNPFEIGEEVDDICYCEKCNAFYSKSWCNEHGEIIEC